jgi:hypothetical protein
VKKRFVFIALVLSMSHQSVPAFKIGVETDVATFITGGFHISAWYGTGDWRYRAVWSHVRVPDRVMRGGFTDGRVTTFALMADHFTDRGDMFDRWWASTGVSLWFSHVGHDDEYEVGKYWSLVIPAESGYLWGHYRKAWNSWYLNPWAGVHIRALGTSDVKVGDHTFHPYRVVPTASIKFGSGL